MEILLKVYLNFKLVRFLFFFLMKIVRSSFIDVISVVDHSISVQGILQPWPNILESRVFDKQKTCRLMVIQLIQISQIEEYKFHN